ncbi:MAG: hypothetical protein AAF206_03500 [Bacteroidota bacterium]
MPVRTNFLKSLTGLNGHFSNYTLDFTVFPSPDLLIGARFEACRINHATYHQLAAVPVALTNCTII